MNYENYIYGPQNPFYCVCAIFGKEYIPSLSLIPDYWGKNLPKIWYIQKIQIHKKDIMLCLQKVYSDQTEQQVINIIDWLENGPLKLDDNQKYDIFFGCGYILISHLFTLHQKDVAPAEKKKIQNEEYKDKVSELNIEILIARIHAVRRIIKKLKNDADDFFGALTQLQHPKQQLKDVEDMLLNIIESLDNLNYYPKLIRDHEKEVLKSYSNPKRLINEHGKNMMRYLGNIFVELPECKVNLKKLKIKYNKKQCSIYLNEILELFGVPVSVDHLRQHIL